MGGGGGGSLHSLFFFGLFVNMHSYIPMDMEISRMCFYLNTRQIKLHYITAMEK